MKELLIQQFPKNNQKVTQFGISVSNGESTGLTAIFFQISEQAHTESVLDFVDKQRVKEAEK